MIKRNRRINAICYVLLITASVFVLFPLMYMVSTSFKSINEIMTAPVVTVFPKQLSLEGYRHILKEYHFFTYLKNSVVVTFVSTFICVVFSTLGGYGFSRFRFQGKAAIMMFILVTQMFPSVMLFVPYYKLLSTFGLAKSHAGIILVYTAGTLPFCSWMMYGFFNSISRELDEAARIDGAGYIRTFLQVIAPLTLPGIISTTIYGFLHSWNEYMFAMLCISRDSMKTLPLVIGQMAGFDKIQWNDLMTASFLSSIPMVILFLFLQRYFVSGMTSGSVKG